jgi:hypothetical protein
MFIHPQVYVRIGLVIHRGYRGALLSPFVPAGRLPRLQSPHQAFRQGFTFGGLEGCRHRQDDLLPGDQITSHRVAVPRNMPAPGICFGARVRGGTPPRVDDTDLPLLRLRVRAEEYLQGFLGIVAPLQQVQSVVSQEGIGSRLGRYRPDASAGVGD